MIVLFEDTLQLPKGRTYQKGGARLEQALFNCLPDDIKKDTFTNLRPKNDNGDVIVEYDMIYNKGNDLISFEVKGLNYYTSRCPERQARLFNQVMRQKQFLNDTYTDDIFKISVVYCFVTGKLDKDLDPSFITRLKENDIIVSVGESPSETVRDAIRQLKALGYFKTQNSNNITVKKIESTNSSNDNSTFLVGSPEKIDDLDFYIKQNKNQNKNPTYADIVLSGI